MFEIVLACSCGNLGTISSTNIFGTIDKDETEGISSLGFHHSIDFEGWEKLANLLDYYFTKQCPQWLPEGLEPWENLRDLCI